MSDSVGSLIQSCLFTTSLSLLFLLFLLPSTPILLLHFSSSFSPVYVRPETWLLGRDVATNALRRRRMRRPLQWSSLWLYVSSVCGCFLPTPLFHRRSHKAPPERSSQRERGMMCLPLQTVMMNPNP